LRTLFLTVSVPVFLSLFLVESDASDASNTISEPYAATTASDLASTAWSARPQHAASCCPTCTATSGLDVSHSSGSVWSDVTGSP
jgi:hypothetical protein